MTNVNDMKPMRLDYVSNKMTQLSLQAQSEYRRICGQQNWLASQLNPERSRVAWSTLAAKTLAFINGVDICVFIKRIFEEIFGKNLTSISGFVNTKVII